MSAFPSVVQFVSAAANTNALTTGAITTTPGNMFVAVVTGELTPSSTPPITDNESNTWAFAVRTTTGSSRIGIYYTTTFLGGAGHTFTYTPTGFDFCTITVLEVSNAIDSAVLGSTNSTVNTGTTHSSGTITAGATDELFIGAGGTDNVSEGLPAITRGGVWFTANAAAAAVSDGYVVGFRHALAGTTDQFVYTTGASFSEGSAIAAFKVASSGGGSSGGAWAYA